LTRNLKASAETRAIPVIAVTGWVKTDDLERALRAGCDSVLPKPCRPDELLAEIDRLLPARWRRCPECHLRNGTSLQLSVDLPDHYFECHNCGHVWKAAPTV